MLYILLLFGPAIATAGRYDNHLPEDCQRVLELLKENYEAGGLIEPSGAINVEKLQNISHTLEDSLPGHFTNEPGLADSPQSYVGADGRTYRFFRGPGENPIHMSDETRWNTKSFDRWQRPQDAVLVGFEANGPRIVPLYSQSNTVVRYRDLGDYQGGFLFGVDKSQESVSYRANEIPLIAVQSHREIFRDPEVMSRLPADLRSLLLSGTTLTTAPSLRHFDSRYVVEPTKQNHSFSVLILASNQGAGRTGILMKDGVPVLVTHNEREYFIEVKGIGLGTMGPVANLSYNTHAVGRSHTGEVENERTGYEKSRLAFAESPLLNDFSIPFYGLDLPQFDHGAPLPFDSKRTELGLAAQVFRLSRSTRRLAYADNSAYGPRYPELPNRLEKAQEFYGEVLARYRLQPPGKSVEFSNPHPENLIYLPEKKGFVHTDYADLHTVESDGTYVRLELPDIEQYGVFRTQTGRDAVLRGLQKVLVPRGLWSEQLEQMKGKPFSLKDLAQTLEREILVPLALQSWPKTQSDITLIPRVDGHSFHYSQLVEGDAHANYDAKSYLEISFRLMGNDLERALVTLKGVSESKAVAKNHPELASQTGAAQKKLEDQLQALRTLHKKHEKEGWNPARLKEYGQELLAAQRQIARALDSITYFSNDSGRNAKAVEQSSLRNFVETEEN